jgi:muramoyltetrapeptide carboxypeptidase
LHSVLNFSISKLIFIPLVIYSTTSQSQKTMTTPANLQKKEYRSNSLQLEKNSNNLKPAIDLLHSWGLEVVIGKTIGLDNNQLAVLMIASR